MKSKTIKIIPKTLFSAIEPEFLEKIDKIVMICEQDSENKRILEKKAKGLASNRKKFLLSDNMRAAGKSSYGLDKEERFMDFCYEILSYDWLNKNYFNNIKFINEINFPGYPDLKAEKGKKLYYCETKYIHKPRDDRDTIDFAPIGYNGIPKMFVREVTNDFMPNLDKKIENALFDANNKFSKISGINRNYKIIFLKYELSTNAFIIAKQNTRSDRLETFVNLELLKSRHKIGKIVEL